MGPIVEFLLKDVTPPALIFAIALILLKAFFDKKLDELTQKSIDKHKHELTELLEEQNRNFEEMQTKLQSNLRIAEELNKQFLEFDISIDEDLRNKRLPVFKNLWMKMKILPKYPRNDNLSYKELKKLAKDFRDWYFNEGGMFLSHESRIAYGEIQEKLVKHSSKADEAKVSSKDYETIRKSCSRLRTQLTIDLDSRRSSKAIETLKKASNHL